MKYFECKLRKTIKLSEGSATGNHGRKMFLSITCFHSNYLTAILVLNCFSLCPTSTFSSKVYYSCPSWLCVHVCSSCFLTNIPQSLHQKQESHPAPRLSGLCVSFLTVWCVDPCCLVSSSLCSFDSAWPLAVLLLEVFSQVLVVGVAPLSCSHVGLQSAAPDNQESACSSEALRSSIRSTDWLLCACCALPLCLNSLLVCPCVRACLSMAPGELITDLSLLLDSGGT